MPGQSWRPSWGPPTPGCRSVGAPLPALRVGARVAPGVGTPWLGVGALSPLCHLSPSLSRWVGAPCPCHALPGVPGTPRWLAAGTRVLAPVPCSPPSADLREQGGDDGLLQPAPALPGEAVPTAFTLQEQTPGICDHKSSLNWGPPQPVPDLSPLLWGPSLAATRHTAHLVAARTCR